MIYLIPYYFMFGIKVYMCQFLDFQEKLMLRSLIMLLSLIGNMILNYYLIPKYGALGAVIATLITEVPNFSYATIASKLVWKKIKGSYLN